MLNYSSFSDIYRRYEESGLKVRDFCHNEGIHETTFYYWTRKSKKRQQFSTDHFVPMIVENNPVSTVLPDNAPLTSSDQNITCEVSFPSGASLKLKGDISPDYLQVFLHTLSR